MKLPGEWYLSPIWQGKDETSAVSDVEILDNGWLRYTLGGKVYVANGAVVLRQPVAKKTEGAKGSDAV